MSDNIAIEAENLSKLYKLYATPQDRLKEALHPLRKRYHTDFYALKNFSAEIRNGQCIGVLGKNGSGKSTLLKIISGVLEPTSGQIQVRGKISALLELGAGFNSEFTGIENIYFSGALMGIARCDMNKKISGIIEFADIGDFVHQPVKTYSSGMYVRLAFAVAISLDPEILIVDEALAVGDLNFQARCYKKFNEYLEQKKTILFVTHSMDNIIKYCDRAYVLNQGTSIFSGSPKEAVDIYKRLQVDCLKSENGSSTDVEVDPSEVEGLPIKSHFELNKDAINYGNGKAEIVDFAVLDEKGRPTQQLMSNEMFTVHITVSFKDTVYNPIFAFTIKDIKGMEITGTNTLFRDVFTGNRKSGERVTVDFRQTISLRSGHYSLSLGCTNWSPDFVVYHRIYDVLFFEVINEKSFVGFFDPSSNITLKG